MVAGRERAPTTNKKHLQCFVIYKVRTRFSTLKKQLQDKGHIDRMAGNSQQASDYCKKDGDFQEFGTFELLAGYGGKHGSGGKQKQINYEEIIRLAVDHNPNAIRETNPGVYFRHYHTIKRIMQDNPPVVEDRDELDNEWIWGPTGMGKSWSARVDNPGYYPKSHNKWWMGYMGQHCALIDDIGINQKWFGDFLKQWCDHYAFPSEDKGGGAVIRPGKIVVTSNYCIEEIWKDDPQLVEALNRRFKVRHLTEPIDRDNYVPKVVIPVDDLYAEHSAHSEDEFSESDEEIQVSDGEDHDEPSMEY